MRRRLEERSMHRRLMGRGVAALVVFVMLGVGVAGAAAWKIQSSAWLRDLQSTSANTTDGARAHLTASPMGDGTTHVELRLTGLDKTMEGTTYGAHVHTGTCVADNGTAAGPHFTHAGSEPLAEREIWLDFTVQRGGVAHSETTVDFQVPAGGAHAVVIHALPTNTDTGVAGARTACLPVEF
jgi:Cu-Zn family superoxide dismutase